MGMYLPLIDGKGIDREVIEDQPTPCPECGEQMRYEPRIIDEEYYAFAVCTDDECGEEFEF